MEMWVDGVLVRVVIGVEFCFWKVCRELREMWWGVCVFWKVVLVLVVF